MEVISVKDLNIHGVKVISFSKKRDERGYFSEVFRVNIESIDSIFVQVNESLSKSNTIRGLHIQPGMGKLVRVIYGKIIDLFLDTRKDSKTFGKISAYELSSSPYDHHSEWIWIPPGIAHGIVAEEQSLVQYMCTDFYNVKTDRSINLFSKEIDWSNCNIKFQSKVRLIGYCGSLIISDKDKNAKSFNEWKKENIT